MSINHHQQRQLYRIESRLSRSEPHLAAMLTVFGRLSAGQCLPAWEQVPSRQDRIGEAIARIVQAVVAIAATVIIVIRAVVARLTAPFSDRRPHRSASKPESTARDRETGNSQNPAEWA
jgi:hypothetical protein